MRHDLIFKGAVKTAVLGLVAVLGAGVACADYVNYESMINDASVNAVPPSVPTSVTGPTSSVTFHLNGTDIKLVNYSTTSPTGAGATYNYAGGDGIFIPIGTINVPVTSSTPLTTINDLHFSFKVNLNDFLNPQLGSPTGSGVVTVSGDLSGSIGSDKQGTALNLSMTDYHTDLPNNLITIGSTTYEVLAQNASNYFNAPTTAGAGTFQIHIRAVTPQAVPEPASLVMLGLGGSLGLAGLVRRRRNQAA
jgi:hypothetical protein